MALTQASLPGSVLVDADTHTYTIYDGYPKAQFHFLIMPRLPFAVDEDLGNGKRRRGEVGARELDSIGSLLQSPHAEFVLDRLAAASERVRRRGYMLTAAGAPDTRVDAPHGRGPRHTRAALYGRGAGGYLGHPLRISRDPIDAASAHACALAHDGALMQVISDDLVSDRLKHKKVRDHRR